MAVITQTIRWKDQSAGIVQKVASEIAIPNSVPFAINIDFNNDLGKAVSREGTNRIGNQLSVGNPCLGLHYFRDSVGSNHKLFSAFNGTIFDTAGSTGEVSGLTATARCHFVTFLDEVLMLNGDQSRSTNGNGTWVTSGGSLNVAGVPGGAQFPEEWHDRLYALVVDRLYFTSTPSTGTVSWGAAGSGSIQIEQEDGGGTGTALAKVPGYLLIFKERSLKRWNFDSTFPDDLVSLGTQSASSVVKARGRCFFFYGPLGFYETNGGRPVRISRPVQRFVDAIPSSYYADVSGGSDEEHVYWSIGDVTIDFDGLGSVYSETHNNVVLRYTIDTQVWTAYKYDDEFRQFSRYTSGTDVVLTGGTDDGEVLQLNTGNTDFSGVPITYILQSDELNFGYSERMKTISDRIIAQSLNADGAMVQGYGTGEN